MLINRENLAYWMGYCAGLRGNPRQRYSKRSLQIAWLRGYNKGKEERGRDE